MAWRLPLLVLAVSIASCASAPVATAMSGDNGAPPPPECKPGYVYDQWKQQCVPAESGRAPPDLSGRA